MNAQTNETDLPLSDARHPMHRPATATVTEGNRDKLAAAVAKKAATPKKASAPKVAKAATPKKAAKVVEAKEGDEAPSLPKSIVPKRFKEAYSEHNNTCGDKLALALKSATTTKNADGRDCVDMAALKAIAAENTIDTKRYEGLNNGQWRMNIGNKLRGLIKSGVTVVVGKQRFAQSGLTKEAA